jgi:hypothetical protein
MLMLTATYADAWNVVELAQPEMLAQPRAPPRALDTYVHGSAEEIGEALVAYEELGVSHIMVRTIPSTMIGLTQLTRALQATAGFRQVRPPEWHATMVSAPR